MYKLGLIVEAMNDFQMISTLYQKEQTGHFNLALCQYQLGKYAEGLATIDVLIKQCPGALSELQRILEEYKEHKAAGLANFYHPNTSGYDYELLGDAYLLKAGCEFRLASSYKAAATESIQTTLKEDIGLTKYLNCINYSRKFQEVKTLTSKRKIKKRTHSELKQELRNAIIAEMQYDIEEAVGTYNSTLSRSVPKPFKKKLSYDEECTNIQIGNYQQSATSENSQAMRLTREFDLSRDKQRALQRVKVRSETRSIDLKVDGIRRSQRMGSQSDNDGSSNGSAHGHVVDEDLEGLPDDPELRKVLNWMQWQGLKASLIERK